MTSTNLSEQTSHLVHRGLDAVHDGALQMREKAHVGTDATVHYIQHEPIKSVLIAAAAGATLMALVGLVANARSR